MKLKTLVLLILILQICLFVFGLIFVPEQVSTITNGLAALKQKCPDCASFSSTDSGLIKLINPGDYFLAASGGIKFLTAVIFVFVTASIILLFAVLVLMRKDRKISTA